MTKARKIKEDGDYKKFSIISPKIMKELLRLPKPVGAELFRRVNYKLHLAKDKILKQAFERYLFTEKEYEEKYKDMFYDDYGADSFAQYINAAMNAKADYFVTSNERMLNRKKELENRFGLKITSPEEVLEKHGRKDR